MRQLKMEELEIVSGAHGLEPPAGEALARNLQSLVDSLWSPAIVEDSLWEEFVSAQ